MDDQSLLNGPEPQPPTGTAAEAFARLVARVEALEQRLDGRLAVIARALEHIAVEKQCIEVPDYNPTLAKINAALAELAKYMKALSQSEALKLTPESMGERIVASAETAREADRATIKEMRELNRQAITALNRSTGTLRDKREQRRHLLYAIGGATLATSLLWLIYPGWAANIGPQGWLWPERVAARTMGFDRWTAGERLLATADPERWRTVLHSNALAQANRDVIGKCLETAAQAKKPVQCVIEVAPES